MDSQTEKSPLKQLVSMMGTLRDSMIMEQDHLLTCPVMTVGTTSMKHQIPITTLDMPMGTMMRFQKRIIVHTRMGIGKHMLGTKEILVVDEEHSHQLIAYQSLSRT